MIALTNYSFYDNNTMNLIYHYDNNCTAITKTMTTHTSTTGYYYSYSSDLMTFGAWYQGIHGYLATIICVFGILANFCNIIVLTKKNMVSSTNCILTGLAVSDGLTMLAYLPFALRFYCLYGISPSPERNSLPAIRYMLFFACFSVVVHTASIWLTLTLAVFRYIFLSYPNERGQLCSLRRTKLTVFGIFILAIVACVPNIMSLTIQGHQVLYANRNVTIWVVTFKYNSPFHVTIYYINFWIQALLVKLLPGLILTFLSLVLIRAIYNVDRRRNALLKTRRRRSEYSGDRKAILLAVVILFLLTEFPHGILSLLSGLLPHFVDEIYSPLGDIMDILALINNGVNFILYCTMSKKFRTTFSQTFIHPVIRLRRYLCAVLYLLNPYSYVSRDEM